MPLFFIKFSNSVKVNWGPLSKTNCSGSLYVAKSRRNSMIVAGEVVVKDLRALRMGIHDYQKLSTLKKDQQNQRESFAKVQLAKPKGGVVQLGENSSQLGNSHRTLREVCNVHIQLGLPHVTPLMPSSEQCPCEICVALPGLWLVVVWEQSHECPIVYTGSQW